jgi:hypothetical protein
MRQKHKASDTYPIVVLQVAAEELEIKPLRDRNWLYEGCTLEELEKDFFGENRNLLDMKARNKVQRFFSQLKRRKYS